MLLGIDIIILLTVGAVIALGVLYVARRRGFSKEYANLLCDISLATSGLLVVAYILMARILDSLC